MTTIHDAPTGAPPKPRRKAWWIIGGTLTGVILLFSLTWAGVGLWVASSPWETDSLTETHTAPVTGIDLDVAVGEVHLTGGEGPDFQIERHMTWKGYGPVVDEKLTDAGVFEARVKCTEGLAFLLPTNQCKVEYSATVPSGVAAEARTDVADIDVDGLDGELRLVSSVGDINAQHLRTTDTSIETSVGTVTVAFDEVRGDIDIVTSVGDVTILVPDDGTTYDVRFESNVGDDDIRIATDPTAGADHVITVTSSVGDLEVRYVP